MLTWCREQVGLAAPDVDRRLKLPIGTVADWESGRSRPNLYELSQLSEVYYCPVGYFFLEEPPSHDTAELSFRGVAPDKERTLGYETRIQLRRFSILVAYAADLVEAVEGGWSVNIPSIAPAASPQDLASSESHRLGVWADGYKPFLSSQHAFDTWKAAIEETGVFVFSLKLDAGEIRGASMWETGRVPGILVNREDSEATAGRTFTLLHEYYHLLAGQPGVACDFRGRMTGENLERMANVFASEAIVPRQYLLDALKEKNLATYRDIWSDAVLDELKQPFGASRDVIAIALEELKFAPSGFYRLRRPVWERRRPFGRGGGNGQTKVRRTYGYLGKNLSKLLVAAYKSGELTPMEFAEITDLKVERADEFSKLAETG